MHTQICMYMYYVCTCLFAISLLLISFFIPEISFGVIFLHLKHFLLFLLMKFFLWQSPVNFRVPPLFPRDIFPKYTNPGLAIIFFQHIVDLCFIFSVTKTKYFSFEDSQRFFLFLDVLQIFGDVFLLVISFYLLP